VGNKLLTHFAEALTPRDMTYPEEPLSRDRSKKLLNNSVGIQRTVCANKFEIPRENSGR
jgi:hypothetical protein